MSALWEGIAVGDEVASETFALTRDHLVRYAGASGDFNPIHYRDDVAKRVGTAGSIRSYQVRFTKPVYVPADKSTSLTSSATVMKLPEGDSIELTLSLTVMAEGGQVVLGKAIVVVTPR